MKLLLLSHPQKRNVKIIQMFEHVTLFAAGYLRFSKHQKWRGRGHNILGQVLGEYRLRLKRRIKIGDAYYSTGDRLDNDGHMQHAARYCSCTKLLQRGIILSVNHYLILCQL